MDWNALSANALEQMRKLGNFSPTYNAQNREVKGYALGEDGDGYKTYWTSEDLRKIAAACNEVADWLDERADKEGAAA